MKIFCVEREVDMNTLIFREVIYKEPGKIRGIGCPAEFLLPYQIILKRT